MDPNYQATINHQIDQKVTKLIQTSQEYTVDKLSRIYHKQPSKQFQIAFDQNINQYRDTVIQHLYINRLHEEFDPITKQTLQRYADHYSMHELYQLLHAKIKAVFNQKMQTQFQYTIDQFANDTLDQIEF